MRRHTARSPAEPQCGRVGKHYQRAARRYADSRGQKRYASPTVRLGLFYCGHYERPYRRRHHYSRRETVECGRRVFSRASPPREKHGSRARRSPGSTLKPFIYALALEQGLIGEKADFFYEVFSVRPVLKIKRQI